ncbi:MAG TPA: hypothetical protein VHT53_10520 [Candidatus Elarobacter sp.]|jgi:hypothetical protein|nr:hypothetical protein [Candidatus Elarobacter sp.]
MQRPSHGNPMEVSAYWTPQHVDVTDAPVRYAGPKATWLEEFRRLRPRPASDVSDRMARRRAHTHAIVDANEILAPPPVPLPAPRRAERTRSDVRAWFGMVFG